MVPMRVLITNCWLDARTGTELYVRDLALALQRAGHLPMAYSPLLGEVAAELRQAGVPATDDLSGPLPTPDIVHGHHTFETLAALTRFPSTPGLYVEHDAVAWQDEPLHHPRLLRHLAVDEVCRERLVVAGIDANDTEVVPNGVDLMRFVRRPPLPASPRRALVLTNSPGGSFVTAIADACAARGLSLDVLGGVSGQPVLPENVLADYDVVFAKARTALEAMAVGCAVVVCDQRGVAGMLTRQVQDEWRQWNFGRKLLTQRHTAGAIAAELDRYDREDAAQCTDVARAEYSLDVMVGRLVEIYEEVVKQHVAESSDPVAELVALAPRVARLGPLRLTEDRYEGLRAHADHLERHGAHLEAERQKVSVAAAQLGAELAESTARLDQLVRRVAELEDALTAQESRAVALAGERDAFARTPDDSARVAVARACDAEARAREADEAVAEANALRADLRAVEGTVTFRLRAAVLRSRTGRVLVRVLRRGRR